MFAPPVWKGPSGIQSVGFDPFADYDLDSKDQRGTVPTHYGTREQLARCVAMQL
jgi:alpha-amylase